MYKVKNITAVNPHKLENDINSFFRSLDEQYLTWELIDVKIEYAAMDSGYLMATVIYNYTKNDDIAYDDLMKEIYQNAGSAASV